MRKLKRAIPIVAFALYVQASTGENTVSTATGLPPVSRSSGKIAAGTVWETDYFAIDSGVIGATVLMIGGMHGNEPAGSRAAEQILHWPMTSGKLIVVPRANVLALEANTRLTPGEPEEAANLNRNFPHVNQGGGNRVTPRGELAASLWRLSTEVRPAWVIDLHEGYAFHRSHNPSNGKTKSVGSSVIYQGGETMDALAERMVSAADATVTDPSKRFSLIRGGPIDGGLVRACIAMLGAEGGYLETTFKAQASRTGHSIQSRSREVV